MENKIKKITKKDRFNELLAIAEIKENAELVDFINHEIELLNRKKSSSGDKKMTPAQIENENIKATILEILADSGIKMTISEMQKADERLEDYTNQKMSALLKQLIDSGKVTKSMDKRKAYFEITEK